MSTPRKELVGNKANGGREYQPVGQPDEVDVHDFPDPEIGKAIPYGVYDIGANNAWVSVGDDHDTTTFAHDDRPLVDTMGSAAYPIHTGCWSPPTPADPTATGADSGRSSSPSSPNAPASTSPCATTTGTSKWKYGTNPETGRTSRVLMPIYLLFLGAQSENRTRDLRITNALLYRLSYLGAQDAQGVMLSVGFGGHDGDCGPAPATGSRPFQVPADA